MILISTRRPDASSSFRDALLAGLAPDGGLFIPRSIPALPGGALEAGAFDALAFEILRTWIGDEVDDASLRAIAKDAFDFPVPVVPLRGGGWDGVHVLELFHGPTLSFKDFGARTMARLMAHFLAEAERSLTVLVATSGDTGSAVADGFSGLSGIRVGLLYPEGQVSPVQERQLIVRRPGVDAFAVAGTFDDCQRLVKAAFRDGDLTALGLSSANSINIGRLLPQMLYYAEAIRAAGLERPVFCTPSGNLGNLTGGLLAALSGLPARRFIAAHNANDFFPRHLAGEAGGFTDSVRTLSNAMDVGAPSNFERLEALLTPEERRRWIWGTSVTDDETLASMRRVYEATGYVACPHTAVGLEAARRYRKADGEAAPIVVLATAHPAKFPEVVRRAIGVEPAAPARLAALWQQPTHARPLPPTLEALKEALLRPAASANP